MADSTADTVAHIDKVRARIYEVTALLHKRAFHHDESKLIEPEKSGYDLLTNAMAGKVYGTDEYTTAMAEVMANPAVEAAWKHHYTHNSHHPEYYENGIAGMSLLDVIEMLCDWKGASERNGPRAFSIAYSITRHKIDPQLATILENTVKELGW